MSERELAEKIIHLHEVVGLGFRKIAQRLTSEGIEISKDTAFRLFHKYKKDDAVNVEEDKELAQLEETEKNAQKDLRLLRKKEEARRRIAAITLEKAMTTFERRKQLFSDADELLKFAEIVMPIIDPMLWDEFKEVCEEQGYDLDNTLATAIGKQRYFEDQLAEDTGEKLSLDLYLSENIEEALNAWNVENEEESTEYDSVDEYGGYEKNGWYYISIPRELHTDE